MNPSSIQFSSSVSTTLAIRTGVRCTLTKLPSSSIYSSYVKSLFKRISGREFDFAWVSVESCRSDIQVNPNNAISPPASNPIHPAIQNAVLIFFCLVIMVNRFRVRLSLSRRTTGSCSSGKDIIKNHYYKSACATQKRREENLPALSKSL